MCWLSARQNEKNADSDPQPPAKMSNTRQLPPLPQRNRFSVLFNDEIDEAEIAEQPNDSDNTSEIKVKSNKAPPPIIIHKKPEDHTTFVKELKTKLKKRFHIKYSSNNTNVYVHDIDEWRDFKDEIDLENVPYFTYTPKEEREHAFIIRGLDNAPSEEELIRMLKIENDIVITKCFKLKTKRPLYLVTTANDYTERMLNNHARYVDHTCITWERRRSNPRLMIQCHRCQRWGHATSNCRVAPRCLKCAQAHLTHECKKPADVPAKCANCLKEHPSNNTECEICREKLKYLAPRQRQEEPVYIPAPPPATNAWNRKKRRFSCSLSAKTTRNYKKTKRCEP